MKTTRHNNSGYKLLADAGTLKNPIPHEMKWASAEALALDASIASDHGDALKKISSAIFYGFSSVLIIFVNKILLTNLRFPSFLFIAIGQMAMTIVLLLLAKIFGIVTFPHLDHTIARRIFPLPLFYALNLVSGLGGTQKTNLPMFTVLRRFSILMTMLLEYFILGTRPSYAVKLSVFLMIFGSFIAGIYDLSFNVHGYALIFLNNICTAANGVYVKKKLESRDLGKYGLMYYNSLFMFVPTMIATLLFSDDLSHVNNFYYNNELNAAVVICFLFSCVCGFILNYSLVLCSSYNSALTTTCVGPIKNLIVTYVGMVSSGDYVFQWVNFIGVNISVLGSVLYTYVTFRTPKNRDQTADTSARRDRSRQITVRPTEKLIKPNDEFLLPI